MRNGKARIRITFEPWVAKNLFDCQDAMVLLDMLRFAGKIQRLGGPGVPSLSAGFEYETTGIAASQDVARWKSFGIKAETVE